MKAIININNKYKRRAVLVVLVIPSIVASVCIAVVEHIKEILTDLPPALVEAWKGRE
jgi:peroxiredoxin